MARTTEVPITASVLRWAIEESGYDPEQIAHAAGVHLSVLNQWMAGETVPSLTHARKLASKLHRPFAALLLPEPPQSRPLHVDFRHPIGEQRELNPNERRYLRRAARFQEVLSWLVQELGVEKPRLPSGTVTDDPVRTASVARDLLRISVTEQRGWSNSSVAFDGWRTALERVGLLVFLFSLGKDACRGFSLWDEYAPVIAVNTSWNESARIFTMFHEFAHLITRTSSACVESVHANSRTDPVERWCEQFAAAVLMPAKDVGAALRLQGLPPGAHVTSVSVAGRIANLFKVSLRAAVIRLVELGAASWELFDQIPPISDGKPPSGGGRGRSRTQIREDQLGERATSLLVSGVEHDVLSRSQAVEFLDIPDVKFDELSRADRK